MFQWQLAHRPRDLSELHAASSALLKALNGLELLTPVEFELANPQVSFCLEQIENPCVRLSDLTCFYGIRAQPRVEWTD